LLPGVEARPVHLHRLRRRPRKALRARHKISDDLVGFTTDWSPDGRSIVADSQGALLVFDAANPAVAPRQIIVSKGSAFGARWSPDRSRFVFSLCNVRLSHPNIYTMNVDGSDLWQVTRGAD
jgi:hypothetical protein